MDPILVSFSFLAGMQAFFAPCSIALIPAYVGYYVSEETGQTDRTKQLLFGLKAGSFASLGILSIYITFGVILALLGRIIAPFIPWLELFTGSLLLFIGAAVLLGYGFALRPPVVIQTKSRGAKRFYLFGVAYAFGALGCTLPIFLLVIFQSLAQRGLVGGFINFLAYALAMTILMITFSLIAAVSKTTISTFLKNHMEKIQKSAGLLIFFAGVYLVYLALKVITI